MTNISVHKQSGFTLLETLLVVGLMSGVLMVLSLFTQDVVKREHTRGVAEHMALMQKAVDSSISTVEQFNAFYQLAANHGGVAEVSILARNNPHRTMNYSATGNVSLEKGNAGSINANNIINASYTPDGSEAFSEFPDTVPIRASSYVTEIDGAGNNAWRNARLTVLMRVADDLSDADDERALEILIVSIDRIAEADLRSISTAMDAHGGFIAASNSDDCVIVDVACAVVARSAFGNWYTSIKNYAGTYWYDDIAKTQRANATDGGYLASYSYVNESILAGDYLYRIPIEGRPDLNTMHTALDLGGNNIVGADNVEISSADSEPALVVKNGFYANGSVYVADSAHITGDLNVVGKMKAGNVELHRHYTDPTIIPPANGHIAALETFEAKNLDTSNSVSVRNKATLKTLDAGQTGADSIVVQQRMTANGAVLVNKLVNTKKIIVDQDLTAGQVNAGKLDVQTLGVVQGQMDGGLTVQKRLSAGSGKVSVSGNVNINNLTQCTIGC